LVHLGQERPSIDLDLTHALDGFDCSDKSGRVARDLDAHARPGKRGSKGGGRAQP
jgi:hypothetical protein